jgi:hypothetical protein
LAKEDAKKASQWNIYDPHIPFAKSDKTNGRATEHGCGNQLDPEFRCPLGSAVSKQHQDDRAGERAQGEYDTKAVNWGVHGF